MSYEIKIGNAIDKLKEIEDESVDCVITSPPYYGLRDYGTGEWVGGDENCSHQRDSKRSDKTGTGHKAMNDAGHVVGDGIYKVKCPKCGAKRVDNQIGLEATPEGYIKNLVTVFREVHRTLKSTGTVWLNIGDSYWNGMGQKHDVFKKKDLMLMPHRLAIALQEDGWYVRQDIVWAKNNPMPETVKDRCTKAHEYIFLLTKKPRYFYNHNAVFEPAVNGGLRNKRTVWKMSLKPYKKAHFAVYPPKLIEHCILTTPNKVCSDCGTGYYFVNDNDLKKCDCDTNETIPAVILDPFAGSGTTGGVAEKHGRNSILIELNPEYAKLIDERIKSIVEG